MTGARVPMPALSGVAAAGIGTGVAVTTITLASPDRGVGLGAALAGLAGSVAVAIGLRWYSTPAPLWAFPRGVVLFVGAVLLTVAGGLVVSSSPPVTWLAALPAVVGQVLLFVCLCGYTDPSSLTGPGGDVARFGVAPLVVGLAVVGIPSVSGSVAVGQLAGSYGSYIAMRPTNGLLLFFGHLVASYVVATGVLSELRHLRLLAQARTAEIRRRLRTVLAAVGGLVLAPFLFRQSPFGEGLQRVIAATAGLVQSVLVHSAFVVVEGLLVGCFLGLLAMHLLRRFELQASIRYAAYLAVTVVVVPTVYGGLGLVLQQVDRAVVDSIAFGVPLGDPVTRVGVSGLLAAGLLIGLGGGFVSLRVVLSGLYRFESRGVPVAVGAGLVAGVSFLPFTGVQPVVVAGCLGGAILAWDLLEYGVGLGESLDARFASVPNEVVHVFAAGSITVLAVAVGILTFQSARRVSPTTAPSVLVLAFLLVASVLFLFHLRRR